MPGNNLIIFDIDGTLFQTDLVTVPAVQQAFAEKGLPQPTREQICFFFGKSVQSYELWLAEQCPLPVAAHIVERANQVEIQLIGEKGRLYPRSREVLVQLRQQGYDLAICSNGPEPYVQEVLKAHGLTDFFSVVCARGMQNHDKGDMVNFILKQLQPKHFAVVGDRRDDIEAAHRHGGRGIAAVYGFGSPEEWQYADARVGAITELPKCLESLFHS